MINNLILKNNATYSNMQTLTNLNKINFFYGSNGVGKTTIGNILNNINKFPESSIEWKSNQEKEILVYNKEFVEENFGENKTEHRGIFTLGKATKQELELINTLKETVSNLSYDIQKKSETLTSKKNEFLTADNLFKEKIWKVKNSYIPELKIAFEGLHSSKEKLKATFLDNITNNISELLSIEQIKEKYHILYSDEKFEIEQIDFSFLYNLSLNDFKIFSKPIIGSEDLDISYLITTLKNADWVYKGIKYLNDSSKCPFCQQDINPNELKNNLEKYFDEKYSSELKKIHEIEQLYHKNISECYSQFNSIFSPLYKFIFEKDLLKDIDYKILLLKEKINININLIKNKINEPSKKILLNDITEDIEEIINLGSQLNLKIKKNNELIKNIKKEKDIYKKSVWRYFLEDCKSAYEIYNIEVAPIKKAIEGINKLLLDLNNKLPIEKEKLRIATSNLTTTKPTVEAINKLLKEFGFKGFQLIEKSTGYYQIVRENGELATNTLSEGEKNFLTFLYFCHLIKGSHNKEKINNEKIIVIDDPISSLDSTVLFIVSTLIKKIILDISKDKGDIKQIFILTHNVYFHKEISFIKIDSKYTKYFIIRKNNNNTEIEDCQNENKIQTSYQLLWNEVKNNNTNGIHLQNAMRRILENFFGFLGKYYDEKIISEFSTIEEQDVVRSLFSWVNDGSHCIQDDIHLSCIDNNTIPYKQIFKDIFIKTGYAEHYNMMSQ